MKNNVIDIKAAKHHIASTAHYTEGVREVDGVAGFIRNELLGVLEETALAFDYDYQELTVGDVLEYLVAREEDRQR